MYQHWPGRTSRGDTSPAGSTASSRDSASRWHRPRSGRSSRTLASARHRAGTALAGRSSCGPRQQGILALDFFIADLLNGAKVYVLAVIEHGTRGVRILGATEHPVQSWVVQQARNLLMDLDDAGLSVRFILHDRDSSFPAAFDAVFQAAGARAWQVKPKRVMAFSRIVRACRCPARRNLRLEGPWRSVVARAAGLRRVRGGLLSQS
jgi:hypothetical protein